MNRFLRTFAVAAVTVAAPLAALAADWTPPGPIKLMIGFGAGGGADTQARLIAEAIEAKHGWTILPEQVTGNSGLNLLTALKDEPADGTAIGMIVTETMAYNLVASPESGLNAGDFTPLATTAAFQMGLVAMADGEFSSWEQVKAAAEAGKAVRFGTATTRQGDMAYHLGKGAGIDFNIVSVKGGKAIMNGLRGGDLDIGWVAGAQAKAVAQGEMINVARGIDTPLRETPEAPSITDIGSQFYLDGYFMFAAPGGMDPAVRDALAGAIAEVLADSGTGASQLVTRAFGGATVIKGDELDAMLAKAAGDSQALLKDVTE